MSEPAATLRSLLAAQKAARAATGWAFDGHSVKSHEPLPWDYREIVRDHLSAKSVLELGTGGGEVFSDALSDYAGLAIATEEWEVNAPVARDRLQVVGVPVVQCSSLHLPFADGLFDLILSRHEAIEPSEINRVLADGGTFVTQQVTYDSWCEVHDYFPRATRFPNHFIEYREAFETLGFNIERAETFSYAVTFPGMPALVYMLTRDIWTVPDFDVEADLEALREMESKIGGPNGIALTEGRYIMIARKGIEQ